VLKTVRYAGRLRDVETGEILLFVNRDFLVSVRHDEAALPDVRLEIENRPDLLRFGSGAVLYAIVDDYEPVVEAVEADIQEVEHEVFAPTRSTRPSRSTRSSGRCSTCTARSPPSRPAWPPSTG
jgi:magnesium transporter